MIIEYQRPSTIEEALVLLSRDEPRSHPLGGGTFLNRPQDTEFAVVDLQDLGLNEISMKGNSIEIGATTTLESLVQFKNFSADIINAVRLEATYNIRQMATIAGTLVTANGRSPLATMFLSLDAGLEIMSTGNKRIQVKLGDWLPVRAKREPGTIITKINLPSNARVAYESIARSPADQPIVCAAVAGWPSGRTRVALGGFGKAPILAMDGPEADGIENAAKNAYSHAGDEWASAEYRMEMAGILASRCLNRIIQK